MEITEVKNMLNHMREMVERASFRLEEGLKQTQENETKIYWLNVKISNNSRKFTNEEINTADKMGKELMEVTEGYTEMLNTAKDILLEIDTYMEKLSECDDSDNDEKLKTIYEGIRFGGINEKVEFCLLRAKLCLETQNRLLMDEKELEDSLRERTVSKNVWFVKLKSLLKGVHML